MIKILVLFAVAAALLSQSGVSAFAQERGPTKEEIVDANYSGPIIQDAFWTDYEEPASSVAVRYATIFKECVYSRQHRYRVENYPLLALHLNEIL